MFPRYLIMSIVDHNRERRSMPIKPLKIKRIDFHWLIQFRQFEESKLPNGTPAAGYDNAG